MRSVIAVSSIIAFKLSFETFLRSSYRGVVETFEGPRNSGETAGIFSTAEYTVRRYGARH